MTAAELASAWRTDRAAELAAYHVRTGSPNAAWETSRALILREAASLC